MLRLSPFNCSMLHKVTTYPKILVFRGYHSLFKLLHFVALPSVSVCIGLKPGGRRRIFYLALKGEAIPACADCFCQYTNGLLEGAYSFTYNVLFWGRAIAEKKGLCVSIVHVSEWKAL
jgi:hypothetical protein